MLTAILILALVIWIFIISIDMNYIKKELQDLERINQYDDRYIDIISDLYEKTTNKMIKNEIELLENKIKNLEIKTANELQEFYTELTKINEYQKSQHKRLKDIENGNNIFEK